MPPYLLTPLFPIYIDLYLCISRSLFILLSPLSIYLPLSRSISPLSIYLPSLDTSLYPPSLFPSRSLSTDLSTPSISPMSLSISPSSDLTPSRPISPPLDRSLYLSGGLYSAPQCSGDFTINPLNDQWASTRSHRIPPATASIQCLETHDHLP